MVLALFAAALGGSGGSSLSVAAEPGFASGGSIGSFPETVASDTITLTASGGAGPYSYSWIRQSGDVAINAVAPSSAATNFYAVNVPVGATYGASFLATVTDSLGATASIEVSVVISNG